MIRDQRYNRKTVKVISVRDEDVLTMAEVKDFCRLSDDQDMPMLNIFRAAAIEAAEQFTSLAIRELTIDLTLDGFPYCDDDALVRLGPGTHNVPPSFVTGRWDAIELPRPPVVSITSITSYNRANMATVMDAAAYRLVDFRAVLNEGYQWPSDLRDQAAVVVRYVAGYGPTLPAPIKVGILQHISAMYDCRAGCEMPVAARGQMQPYRIMDGLAW